MFSSPFSSRSKSESHELKLLQDQIKSLQEMFVLVLPPIQRESASSFPSCPGTSAPAKHVTTFRKTCSR